MFGNTQFTTTVGAAPDVRASMAAGDREQATARLVMFARECANAGLPLLLIEPGSKRPVDMRTDNERKKDTDAAAPGAKTGGVHLATTDKRRLKSYITRALADPDAKRAKGTPAPLGGVPNFAVRLAGSGYVVADADTPAEVAALEQYLRTTTGSVPAPTVLTPGTLDGAHSGGGHWWFKLPEGMAVGDSDMLPAVIKIDVDGHDAGFSLYTGNAYVLIPPSVRDAGAYTMVNADTPAPPDLIDRLNDHLVKAQDLRERRQQQQERAASGELGTLDEQVNDWSAATPWETVLGDHGWTDTGTVDSCGCDVWTAPGTHASHKSATAHGSMCTNERYDALNPPLHIWTDNPGAELEAEIARVGSKTLSKLTVWCALEHGGDMAAALTAAGIEHDPAGHTLDARGNATELGAETAGVSLDAGKSVAGVPDKPADLPNEHDVPVHAEHVAAHRSKVQAPRPPLDLDVTTYTPDGREMWEFWGTKRPVTREDADAARLALPPWGTLGEYNDRPAPEFLLEGLLEAEGLLSVIGDSGVGKSAVVLDMAAHIAAGKTWHGRRVKQCPVVYVAGEGVSGATQRLQAWKRAHECTTIDDQIYIVEEPIQISGSNDQWAYFCEQTVCAQAGLVIFDTFARMSTGMEENSATDMGVGVTVFNRVQRTTGAAVLLVHHTARGASHARGSSALRGAIDSELLITEVMADGRPFAVDMDDNPVDSAGDRLPGRPLTVKSVKQKNAADGEHEYLCLTSYDDSMLVTDLTGNAVTPKFNQVSPVSVTALSEESTTDTAHRVADYVGKYTSGELMPTLSDIARGVTPDRARMDKARAWRDHVGLSVDTALNLRILYKMGDRYTTQPPLD